MLPRSREKPATETAVRDMELYLYLLSDHHFCLESASGNEIDKRSLPEAAAQLGRPFIFIFLEGQQFRFPQVKGLNFHCG